MSEKPTVERILKYLENRLDVHGKPGPWLTLPEAHLLLDGIREMQKRIKSLEKDLEFSNAGYDTVDCTPKEAQPDEEDPNTVSV